MGANVVAGFQEVRGEAVAEAVAGSTLADAGFTDCGVKRALEHGFVKVVAAQIAGVSVAVVTCCGEQPLPGPRLGCIREFSRERTGERDAASSDC